jgi:sugar O-acyltransferase (sialic acid O-acetyltransferase NeuD family)
MMIQTPIRCVLLGGGGHAKVLLDIIAGMPGVSVYGILDGDRAKWGGDLSGVLILGGDDLLDGLVQQGVTHFAVGLGSVGDSGPRRRLFERAGAAGLEPLTLVHPSCLLSPRVVVGEGSQLLPGSIVNASASIGRNVIVNSGAIVEHDCVIGDHAHIATGAVLASTVTVGEGAHIGAGAVVRQGIAIGAGAVVGAGAAVVRDVPANSTVVGVPAVPIERRR